MLFCPKCGSLLRPKKEKSKKIMFCGSCGYVSKNLDDAEIKETIAKKTKTVEVVNEDEENLPLTDAVCPECGHKKAYYWLRQMRAGDEPETRFLKCEKCKHIWREYD